MRPSLYKSSYNPQTQFVATSLTGTMIERKRITHINTPFNPKDYLYVGITEREVEMYKEIFDLFDINGIGSLSPNDLRNALEMFGYHPKRTIVYQIISDLDSDESGGISFNEFLKIMTDQTRPCDEDTEEDYKRIFEYFDCDEKNYMNKEDIQNVAMELNENLTDEELNAIMEKLDPEGTGKVDFKTFYRNMQEAISKKKRFK